ncbi:MAG: galactitol-1-phosphate 5-dehydrogenase [Oscillospiraceae bacterium]|nr:galactitol-1-phosphate 5-dehydrogenase [Oscillospiraceae bacterium]MCL2277795.1 galactitol-1-phosphate 5-dehydrogenase [Oscillospiraceae bacterium]
MASKMRALRLFAPGDIRCVEVDVPVIEKDSQVLVKVKSCGVCGSDIARVMVKGTYSFPTTIGHEFAGEVLEIGSGVKNVEVGDRVTALPMIPCGVCEYCKSAKYHMCDNYDYYGSRRDGAMAEYIVIESANCLKLPSNVDYEMGCMADPMSVALHAVRQSGTVEAGGSAAVYGMGAIGYMTVQWFRALGYTTVYAVDISDEKLRLAERLGATKGINAMQEDPVKEIIALTSGGVDTAVELAGNKITYVQSLQSAKKSGTVIYCGITYDDVVYPNDAIAHILRGEITIRGSWNSLPNPLPIHEWETALRFMQSGAIKVNPLITHRYRLEDGQKAFEMMFNRTEVFTKVLFKPED